MLWRGRRQSDNIEDARGQGGGGMPGGFGRNSGPIRIPIGGRAGGGGITGIIILVVLFFALRACGIDPLQILNGGDRSVAPGGGGTVSETSPPASDEMKQFVATVLAETEDTWNGIFQAEGLKYEEPTLRLFSGSINSACGIASAASGPFYCPGDRKVYLDTDFFDQLANQFGASGDFAEAYVIAHEVGHHVQNLTGVLPKFNQMRQQMSEAEANQMSIRVELQADCFAGIWGHFTDAEGHPGTGRSRRGAQRGAADRRRHAAEEDAGLCRSRKLQPRHVAAAHDLVQARLRQRQACRLRHVQQPGLERAADTR